MKFTQLILNENNNFNFTNDFNLNIKKIEQNSSFKYLNEGASRKVYLNTSSNTVFKIAINKEGTIQNLNEFNLSKSFKATCLLFFITAAKGKKLLYSK